MSDHLPIVPMRSSVLLPGTSLPISAGRPGTLRAIEAAGPDARALLADLDDAMGGAWDRELEAYRHASDASPVVWLHRVG